MPGVPVSGTLGAMYQLKVNQQQSIVALHEQGWSGRRIARELGLDRGTVRISLAGISKPATDPHTGLVGMLIELFVDPGAHRIFATELFAS